MPEFPKTTEVIQKGIDRNLHSGVQISLSYQGQPIEFSYGTARPDVPMSESTILPWLSAGKPFTAIAIAILYERGEIDLDAPISKYLPEFAANGKDDVTFIHVLSHTVGLEDFVTGWPMKGWNEIVDRICQSKRKEDWELGKRGAYDSAKSWFILGEIIQRISGQSFEDFIQTNLIQPLGLIDTTFVYRPEQNDRLAVMYERDRGELKASSWNDRIESKSPSPGASLRGPAKEIRAFFEMLLNKGELNGTRILHPETVKRFTKPTREGLKDETLQHLVDYSLGFIVDSNRYGKKTVPYGFGNHSSETTYGHGGSQCSIGFADPENQLAAAIIANGRPGEGQHQRRFRLLNTALYEDLGIAPV